jgi:exodeoxyribonuclease VII small subunit
MNDPATPQTNDASPSNGGFHFETALQRLREITEAMQNEQLDLDESLKLFEEGNALIVQCQQYLDNTEMKVEQILNREHPEQRSSFFSSNEE